ncbi:MAG: efflux RND transporter periplasmic adaptor subunit [Acidobacteriota bacterium]
MVRAETRSGLGATIGARLRTLRQILRLQLGRHLGAFLALDVLWLAQAIITALLAGDRAEHWIYGFGLLGLVLVVGIPALADLVAVERRAGCLEVALTAPSGNGYFLDRVLVIGVLLVLQGEALLMATWWLAGRSFALLPAALQLAACTVLAVTVTFFWAVRTATAGAAWLVSVATLVVLGPWFFDLPIQTRADGSGPWLPGAEAALAQLPTLVVLIAAAALFFLYGRRRLRQRAALLLVVLCATACAQPAPPTDDEPVQPVTVLPVEAQPFRPQLAALGVVQPATASELVAPFAGEVSYPARLRGGLLAGIVVDAGEALVELSDGDSDRHVAEARLKAEAAQAEYERYQRAVEAGMVSEATLTPYRLDAELTASGLQAAEEQRRRQTLTAPISGVLADVRRLPAGSYVLAGSVLARVLATDRGRVEAWIAARDRPLLEESLRVLLRAPGSGRETDRIPADHTAAGGVAEGRVQEVAPTVEAGALRVSIAVTDPSSLPTPGEGVEVFFELAERPQALVVPLEAVVTSGERSAIFVVERRADGPTANRRQVVLGGRRGQRVEILDGLRPGDRVVVDGVAFLADGDRVREVQAPRLDDSAQQTAARQDTGPP